MARPLRILHLTTASEAGGLSRYICDLSEAMLAGGHDVRVAGARGPWHAIFEEAGIPWIEVPLSGGPWAIWQSIRALRRHLRAHRVDVIHSHYRRTTAVARWLQQHGTDDAGEGTARPRPPIVYTIHLSDMPLRRWGRRWSDFGDLTHVASEEARRWAVESAGVRPQQVRLIPHGVRIDRWPIPDAEAKRRARSQFSLAGVDRVAAYVGRLDEPKNEDWLIDVAARATAIPNLKILVAGAGPRLDSFRRTVEARGLESRVRWLGELSNPLPVYHAADAFLLPSAREGFSLACAEAMCTGVPVLRTRTAGTAELIVEEMTGRSTPIDREAFVAAAIDFLSDASRLASMGRAAAQHIRDHFSFQRQLDRTAELYEEIADRASVLPAGDATAEDGQAP